MRECVLDRHERVRSTGMQTPTFDPGLTQQFAGTLRRAINKDGSFNVRRRGTTWRDTHPYLYLINAPAQRLVSVMNAVGRSLAVVVDQGVKENKFSS